MMPSACLIETFLQGYGSILNTEEESVATLTEQLEVAEGKEAGVLHYRRATANVQQKEYVFHLATKQLIQPLDDHFEAHFPCGVTLYLTCGVGGVGAGMPQCWKTRLRQWSSCEWPAAMTPRPWSRH